MSAGGDEGKRPAYDYGTSGGTSDSSWGLYLGAFVLAALGLIFLNDFRYALAAQTRWTEASGRVTESRVVTSRGRRSNSYHTYLSYTYSTDAGYYSAGPVEINKHKLYFSEDGAWDDLRGKYPEGKSIDVYYNPVSPGESSLGLAGAPGPLVPLAFFLLAGLAFYAGKNQ